MQLQLSLRQPLQEPRGAERAVGEAADLQDGEEVSEKVENKFPVINAALQ